MNFTARLPEPARSFAFDLIRGEQLHPFGPHILRLAHRYPHVGVHEVNAFHRLERITREGDARTGARRDLVGQVDHVLRRL